MSIRYLRACFCPGCAALRAGPNNNQPTPAAPPPPLYSNVVDEKPALVPPPSYRDDDGDGDGDDLEPPLPERTPEQTAADEDEQAESAAAEIVAFLCKTDKTGAALRAALDELIARTSKSTVGAVGWSEWLAESIYDALWSHLRDDFDANGENTRWGVAFVDAYLKTTAILRDHLFDYVVHLYESSDEMTAEELVEVSLSLTAFGILVRMTKWVARLLGFSEVGLVAGMYTHTSRLETVCSLVCIYESDAQLKCFVSQGSFAAEWEARNGGYIPQGSLFPYIQRLGMT